jgi:hypothetical protein
MLANLKNLPDQNLFSRQSPYRVINNLSMASRRSPLWVNPKGNSTAAKNGLRYERKVGKELARFVQQSKFLSLEHNPWFYFEDEEGPGACSPDFLVWAPSQQFVYAVEVKLTWTEQATTKYLNLYLPVLTVALGVKVFPIFICRNLTSTSPKPLHTLSSALDGELRPLHWPEIGRIPW